MVLPIILYGNSILKTKARDIPIEYPNLQELIVNMWDTMNFAKGVGLAAPQIGLPIRLFVVDSIPYYEKNQFTKALEKYLLMLLF